LPNLRVQFNKVHGFYIEVTSSHLDKVPDDYRRRQTLKNAERFITPELKAFEDKALSANERALAREKWLYEQVLDQLQPHVPPSPAWPRRWPRWTCCARWPSARSRWAGARRSSCAEPCIEIEAGRHPVVEARWPKRRAALHRQPHAPERQHAHADHHRPQHGRQIDLHAPGGADRAAGQHGQPCARRQCRLGPIDAIHTRIGAADDLANAQSTFMLEMTEAAQILHAATPHSLVLMDEIGRGTSTFDGLALASGIATHLHDKTRAFTLFATHYFELTELPAKARHAVNMHVSAAESGPTSCSCTKSSPARPAAATASRWPNWPACPRPCCTTPATPWPRWKPSASHSRAQVDLFAAPPARRAGPSAQRSRCWPDHRPRHPEPARGAGRAVPAQETRRQLITPRVLQYLSTAKLYDDLLRRHQTQCRAGFPVRLAHQCRAGPDQHLSQDDRLREAGRPLHGAAVGGQPEHFAVGARDFADRADQGRDDGEPITIWNAKSMFDAARVLGAAVRHVHERDGAALKRAGVDFNVSLMFGGQIQGEGMRLFQVYSAGNFIEATPETPYFQVGESKYGKPVLDRVLTPDTPLDEAAKCALVSMDSTLKSNLSVGLPLDLVVYEADRFQTDKVCASTRTTPTSACCTTAGARSCARCSTASKTRPGTAAKPRCH
jgi:hypothetical protein